MQVRPLVGHGTTDPMSMPMFLQSSTVGIDFGLQDCSPTPVVAMMTRRDNIAHGLFPDLRLVRNNPDPDAFLTKRKLKRGHLHRGRPILQLVPALLRAPHHGKQDTTAWSASLSAPTGTRDEDTPDQGTPDQGWTQRILDRNPAAWFDQAMATRAQAVLRRVTAGRIAGTWWGRQPAVSASRRAVVFAGPDHAATLRLLERAIGESGADRTILVAANPAPFAAFPLAAVLSGVIDPWPLLAEAATIHATPWSDAWTIAALLGKVLARPGGALDPARVAAAALLLGARYLDPFTGQSIACEAFLAMAEDWRRHAATKASIGCCVGVSFWKRDRIAAILGDAATPAFRDTATSALAIAQSRDAAVAVWPSRQPPTLQAEAAKAGVPVFRIEDGFIRSVGLGAEFRPPLSVVCDRLGIYYDSTAPSDLEDILSHSTFDPALLARAATLRDRMVRQGVTKYNLTGSPPLDLPRDRPVLLVPGQVADDRSVELGGAGVRPGLDLLARVRAQAPDAAIVYKPHPDVDAGFREGAISDAEALRYADRVVRGGSMAALLDQIDEVHTLTSLTGFEALLRAKPVTTYGQPFYAGWGLTTDLNRPLRRTRRLELDALVAATLILYPLYFDPVTGLPCGPEIVLDRLADPALHRLTPLMRLRRWQGILIATLQSRPGLLRRGRVHAAPTRKESPNDAA